MPHRALIFCVILAHAMDTTTSSQFSRPTNPGDPVSVVVIVEDSRAMAGKWVDVRDYYLPMLLESLRVADMTVPVCVCFQSHLCSNYFLACQFRCVSGGSQALQPLPHLRRTSRMLANAEIYPTFSLAISQTSQYPPTQSVAA